MCNCNTRGANSTSLGLILGEVELPCFLHIMSLRNTIFWRHGAGGSEREEARESLVSEEGLQHLWDTPELDYLTHVVFRMYENKR